MVDVTALPRLAFAWRDCPPVPLPWIQLREVLLSLLHTPWLLLPLLALLALVATARLPLTAWQQAATVLALIVLASGLYSPVTTGLLEHWLSRQLPTQPSRLPAAPSPRQPVVAVLLGRGAAIAGATTARAAQLVRADAVVAVYVSGDLPATATALVHQGVPTALVAGDSCARTTWENATITAAWLRRHHPGASVALITDPWQLPRAARAFQHQGLAVIPIAAAPPVTASERNRLALRESAATVLYRLQGRV